MCVCKEQASWVRTLLTEPADPVGRSHCSRIQTQIFCFKTQNSIPARVSCFACIYCNSQFLFTSFTSSCVSHYLFPLPKFFSLAQSLYEFCCKTNMFCLSCSSVTLFVYSLVGQSEQNSKPSWWCSSNSDEQLKSLFVQIFNLS